MTSVFKSSAIDFGYNPEFDTLMNNDAIMEYAFNLFLRNVKEGTDEASLFNAVIQCWTENKRKDASYLWEPFSSLLDEIKDIPEACFDRQKTEDRRVYRRNCPDKERIRETLEDLEVLICKSGLERSGKCTYKGILSAVRDGRFADLIGKGKDSAGK